MEAKNEEVKQGRTLRLVSGLDEREQRRLGREIARQNQEAAQQALQCRERKRYTNDYKQKVAETAIKAMDGDLEALATYERLYKSIDRSNVKRWIQASKDGKFDNMTNNGRKAMVVSYSRAAKHPETETKLKDMVRKFCMVSSLEVVTFSSWLRSSFDLNHSFLPSLHHNFLKQPCHACLQLGFAHPSPESSKAIPPP